MLLVPGSFTLWGVPSLLALPGDSGWCVKGERPLWGTARHEVLSLLVLLGASVRYTKGDGLALHPVVLPCEKLLSETARCEVPCLHAGP